MKRTGTYRTFSIRTWIACRGVNGSHTAPAKMLKMLPNDDEDANLIYLQSGIKFIGVHSQFKVEQFTGQESL